jgi:glycosyltransferase involved in cell wall biosynthesis
LHLQEGDSEEYLRTKWWGLIDLSWRLALRRTRFVAAISSYLLDRARRLGYGGEGEVIPIGVDITSFSKEITSEERNRIRTGWGFPINAKVLITSSRLMPKNGVGDIIEALPQLPPEICLVIAGSGELLAGLERKVDELKLTPRVRFVGHVHHEQLPALIKSADIFIRPSLSEGLGISFLEAMAARVPIIGTLVGGIPDFLIDGKTGFACNPNDPESITEAVKRIIALSRDKLDEILQQAFLVASGDYNWESISKRMRAIFSKV